MVQVPTTSSISGMDWNTVGVWFSGLMTLFAVYVALRLQRLFERRDRPQLSARFERKDDCLRYVSAAIASDPTKNQQEPKREELWLRILVMSKGEVAARDVQVQLVDVHRDDDPEPESRSRLGFKASNLNSTTVGLVPNGLPREFDIAFAWHTQGSDDLECRLATSIPEIPSWHDLKDKIERDDRRKLELGHSYRIHVAIFGSNADAVHYELAATFKNHHEFDPEHRAMQGKHALQARVVASLRSL